TPIGTYPVATIGVMSHIIAKTTFRVTTGLVASPATEQPNTDTNVAGTGFQGSEAVNLSWDNPSHTPLATTTADTNGNVNLAIPIPAGATPGSHKFYAVGQSSGTSFNTPVT